MKQRPTGRRCAAALISISIGACAGAAPAAEDIRDIRGPRYVFADWVLAAIIGGAILMAIGIYGLWRGRRNRAARVLLPHEMALQRLEDIRALMQPARAREFCIAVSDIVRVYIEQRFQVTATRRTTEEFLHDLLQSSDSALSQHQGLLGEFLHQCDFVKFAALSLTQGNMESLLQSARAFVSATANSHDSLPAT